MSLDALTSDLRAHFAAHREAAHQERLEQTVCETLGRYLDAQSALGRHGWAQGCGCRAHQAKEAALSAYQKAHGALREVRGG